MPGQRVELRYSRIDKETWPFVLESNIHIQAGDHFFVPCTISAAALHSEAPISYPACIPFITNATPSFSSEFHAKTDPP